MLPTRPNLLFINCHDLGQHLGCYGVGSVSSPHLDALAAEGVRFSRSFCASPQCSPSRACMFTGRYPHANGVMGLTHANFAWDLHPEEIHLAERLRRAGYTTALIGHQHETHTPETKGWQTLRLDVTDDEVADVAGRWIAEVNGKGAPFYLQIGLVRPHRMGTPTGYTAEPDEAKGVTIPAYIADEPSAREDLAAFQGAIREMDRNVGSLLALLDEFGLRENTWVFFTTDHGIPYPRAKCTLHDSGLETALIMRWPRGFAGKRVLKGMVSNIDYVATIAEMIGLPEPEGNQGKSFAGALRERPDYEERTELFGEMTYHDYYDPRRCLRTEDWKLVVYFTAAPFFMDPSQQWRPKTRTVAPVAPEREYHPLCELFDLRADPLELRNRASEPALAELLAELLERLHAWMVETGDPLLRGAVTSPMHDKAIEMLVNRVHHPMAADSH